MIRLLIFLVFASSTSLAADWPHWLGPNYDGKSAESLPEKVDLSRTAWTAEIGIGFSTVSIVDGRVYTMGHEGGKETVWCGSQNVVL